jgi:RHS repeat-associated protein
VRQRYLPYGAPRPGTGAITETDRGFLDKTEDPTGLVALGARYYDPAIGTFVSVDPVLNGATPQALNSYGYALGNPTTLSDPTGLSPACNEDEKDCTQVQNTYVTHQVAVADRDRPVAVAAAKTLKNWTAQVRLNAEIRGINPSQILTPLGLAVYQQSVCPGCDLGETWPDELFGFIQDTLVTLGVVGIAGLIRAGARALVKEVFVVSAEETAATGAEVAETRAGNFLSRLLQRVPRGEAGAARLGRAPEYFGGELSQDQAMGAAEQWLGAGYRETAAGSGRWISEDGLRVIRFGAHETGGVVEHIHFEAYTNGYISENTWAAIIP